MSADRMALIAAAAARRASSPAVATTTEAAIAAVVAAAGNIDLATAKRARAVRAPAPAAAVQEKPARAARAPQPERSLRAAVVSIAIARKAGAISDELALEALERIGVDVPDRSIALGALDELAGRA